MDILKLLDDNPWIIKLFFSILTIVIGVIIYLCISKTVGKRLDANKYLKGNKSKTYFKLFKSINRYIFFLIIIMIILNINGVDITSLATGVGVAGIIFGFAIQDALKDIIKGIDIISDSYYQVGDVIRVDNYTGKVLAIGIKTTRIEDVFEKNIVSISNRNIEKVEVLSHMINIDIPLPYELNLKEAEKTIDYILDNIKKLDKIEKAEYTGVNKLDSSSINYQIKVYASPTNKIQARRDSLTTIVRCLEEKNISVPYTQIDIHNK